ncbi:MAG: hypothetical protein HRU20_01585 [Pseudomonadales bacterium]|nr:hypothetical protein [Pseudomonadales bacterium]
MSVIHQIKKTCCVSLLSLSAMSQAGEWTISAPIHMPNLDIGDGAIQADVQDLAKMANAYMTFGLKYESGDQFYKYQGWHGGYANSASIGLGDLMEALDKPFPPNKDGEIGAGFQLYQTIHAFDFGHKLYENGGFRVYGTLGLRDYDMEITAYGWIQTDGGVPGNGPGSTPIDESASVYLNEHWTEATMGLYAEYDLSKNGMLDISYSRGHKGSERSEAAYRYNFGESGWFTRTGLRKDTFEVDGLVIEESGFLVEFGYTF